MSDQERPNIELSPESLELAAKCNERHVRVVQAILSGDFSSNTIAYMSIYGDEVDSDSARSAVARMLAIDSVKKLHNQLKEEKLLEGALTRAEAIEILTDMAKTSMGDLADFSTHSGLKDDDGNDILQSVWSFKDSKNMSKSALRSISELSATRDGLKIKQHDQKAAIKQLSEMMGWDKAKKVELSGSLKTINAELTLEQATQLYEENLRPSDG